MRPKSLVLLILALGCGLVASIGISEIIDSRNAQTGSTVETEPILVAKVDIERSTELSGENLSLEEWPKGKIPTGAIRDLAAIKDRRPVFKIAAGLPILESMIGAGDAMSAASEIPKGFRVVAVRVTDESGANLIRPGDRVDLQLYASRNPGIGVEKTGTWVFLQDISVFAVNQEITTNPDDKEAIQARTVSLLVTPQQAAKVTLATRIGEIRLVMRGAHDDEGGGETLVNISDLLNTSEKFEDKDKGQQTSQGEGDVAGGKSSSVLDWLNKQKQNQQPAAISATFEMVVMRGAEVSVEQFQQGSHLPTAITADAAGDSDQNDSAQDSSGSDADDKSASSDTDSDSDDGEEGPTKHDD